MKLEAPPYGHITARSTDEFGPKMNRQEQASFEKDWPKSWPSYRQVLQKLFSEYSSENLLEKKQTRLSFEKLVEDEDTGADLLLRFSFDKTAWDIFQKGRTIVHAQPAF